MVLCPTCILHLMSFVSHLIFPAVLTCTRGLSSLVLDMQDCCVIASFFEVPSFFPVDQKNGVACSVVRACERDVTSRGFEVPSSRA